MNAVGGGKDRIPPRIINLSLPYARHIQHVPTPNHSTAAAVAGVMPSAGVPLQLLQELLTCPNGIIVRV